MKRNILAICDSEPEYAYHLMDAFSRKADFPFDMQLFTDADRLHDSLKKTPVQILLIACADFHAEMKDWPAERIVVLWEEGQQEPELAGISKYSGVSRIMKKVLETAAEDGYIPPPVRTDHPFHLFGIYTPVGRCLQTTFAFVTGQLLARNHKVLYLNFEPWSGLGRMLNRSFAAEFSDLLYFLQSPPDQLLARLYGMVESVGGMDMMPPAFSGFDISQMSQEEWIRLLTVLSGGRYEYVILDLSDAVQGLFEILRRCERIYTITREDGFAMAKIEQYEAVLTKGDYGDIIEKAQKITLPLFRKLPANLNHMTSGELARFTERMLEQDGITGI